MDCTVYGWEAELTRDGQRFNGWLAKLVKTPAKPERPE